MAAARNGNLHPHFSCYIQRLSKNDVLTIGSTCHSAIAARLTKQILWEVVEQGLGYAVTQRLRMLFGRAREGPLGTALLVAFELSLLQSIEQIGG